MLDGVDIGTVTDEKLRSFDIARARQSHERRLAVLVARVRVGAGLQQHLDDARITAHGRFRQRRRAVRVGHRSLRAGLQQTLDQRDIIVIDGIVQRRRAVALGRIHIRLVLDERQRAGAVVGLRRLDQAEAQAAPRPGSSVLRSPAPRSESAAHVRAQRSAEPQRSSDLRELLSAVAELVDRHAGAIEHRQQRVRQRRVVRIAQMLAALQLAAAAADEAPWAAGTGCGGRCCSCCCRTE